MPKNKLALPRLMRLAAMLKENRYPNHPRLVAEMRRLDIAGAYHVTQKTVQRDINFLKTDYNAPIAYDAAHRGYYLLDPSWNFDIPTLTRAELDAAVIGAHLIGDILPDPAGGVMRQAVDRLVAANGALSADMRSSLLTLVAVGASMPVAPEIFAEVFKSWQMRHVLQATYRGAGGKRPADLLVEPQVLCFHGGCWYLKARLLKPDLTPDGKDVVTLAVHRIRRASMTDSVFVADHEIAAEVSRGRIFDLPTVKGVVARLTGLSVTYGPEIFGVTPCAADADGGVIIRIPEVEEYRIVNFVMCSHGEARLLEPHDLARKIAAMAAEIHRIHRKS